ncbi:MAG: malectin domain-containing carbohydrate-binding protein, partial [Povalibacter sp.]
MSSRDAEQQELQRVLELLGRETRPGRLLAYVGAKYFQGQEGQLTEFTIATEVFGRSPKTFDPTQDAVVRVEAHRLRKKLREIYDKSHDPVTLQISIPAGTYTLKFVPAPLPQTSAGRPLTDSADSSSEIGSDAGSRRPLSKRAVYALSLISALAVAILVTMTIHRSDPSPKALPPTNIEEHSSTSAAGATDADEVHIMAGYSGSEVIDQSGVHWTPDRLFTGGGQWARDEGFIRRTSRPFLFANWRTGEFGYDLPLKKGVYEMRLFFVSPNHVGEEKLAGFNATLNDQPFLTAFDINISAPGADVAEEQVFRDIEPDQDGYLRLRFTNQVGTASLSAL